MGDAWPDETRDSPVPDRLLQRGIWAFVGLGVMLRLIRFAFDFPLSRDEAMLASNLIDRGYLDLLTPLDHGQVAPVGFLWASKAVIGVLNFSEPTLRLLPLLFGIGSLYLMRRLALRVIPGLPALLAVGSGGCRVHHCTIVVMG